MDKLKNLWEVLRELLDLSFNDLRVLLLIITIGILGFVNYQNNKKINELQYNNTANYLRRTEEQMVVIDSLNNFIITQKISMSKECEEIVDELVTERFEPSIDRYKKLIQVLDKLEKDKLKYEELLKECKNE